VEATFEAVSRVVGALRSKPRFAHSNILCAFEAAPAYASDLLWFGVKTDYAYKTFPAMEGSPSSDRVGCYKDDTTTLSMYTQLRFRMEKKRVKIASDAIYLCSPDIETSGGPKETLDKLLLDQMTSVPGDLSKLSSKKYSPRGQNDLIVATAMAHHWLNVFMTKPAYAHLGLLQDYEGNLICDPQTMQTLPNTRLSFQEHKRIKASL
jgi:hypothetical protein